MRSELGTDRDWTADVLCARASSRYAEGDVNNTQAWSYAVQQELGKDEEKGS